MQPYTPLQYGWSSSLATSTFDHKPGAMMPTYLLAPAPNIISAPNVVAQAPSSHHLSDNQHPAEGETLLLRSPRDSWQKTSSQFERSKPPNDGRGAEVLTPSELKARGDALLHELQMRRAEREARLARDIEACFKQQQDAAIDVDDCSPEGAHPDAKLLARVQHAERLLFQGQEERVRGAVAQEEAVEWQVLLEENRKTTTDIMTMLEAFIREQQALRQVDLQSMEREMARVRLEEDEADIFAERAAEDAKSKRSAQLRSALAGYELQLSRIRRGIGSLEAMWQAMGKHAVTFPVLLKRSANDEATERLYIENLQVQEMIAITNWMVVDIASRHDLVVLLRKEQQSRRALAWSEAQFRGLLHEKERIAVGLKFKQVATGITATNAELRRRAKEVASSPRPAPSVSIPPPAVSGVTLPSWPGPTDSPEHPRGLPLAQSPPAYIFDYNWYPTSPLFSQPPAGPAASPLPPSMARRPPSGFSDRSSLASSLGLPSDPVASCRSWMDDVPVPSQGPPLPRGPELPPDSGYMVHVEAYVTEHVSRYLDAKGQVIEVINAQVDRRETLVPTGRSPGHSQPSSVTRQPPAERSDSPLGYISQPSKVGTPQTQRSPQALQ